MYADVSLSEPLRDTESDVSLLVDILVVNSRKCKNLQANGVMRTLNFMH